MKNLLLLLVLGLSLQIGFAQDAPFEKSGEPGALPFLKKGFRPQIGLSAVGGYQSFTGEGIDKDGISYGLEVSLQCPLLCTKKNYIRQQAGIMVYKNAESSNGTDITFTNTSLTLTPEYRFAMSEKSEYAAGPILGWNLTKTNVKTKNLPANIDQTTKSNGFIYGLSTSATYHFGPLMLALSPQYILGVKQQKTVEGKDTGNDFDPSHFQVLVKLGMKF